MSFVLDPALVCPIDGSPLVAGSGSVRCSNNHSFDIAREGYVNLLGAGDKRSKQPGDSKHAVASRQQFLALGHYSPLLTAICGAMPQLTCDSLVVDAGCGEGYYLDGVRRTLSEGPKCTPRLLGYDISKWAARMAAKRFDATWLVASNRKMPLAGESVDVLLDIFGFPVFGEYVRVLKPTGQVLLVRAGPDHLWQLRRLLYNDVKAAAPARDMSEGFHLLEQRTLAFDFRLNSGEEIASLLAMTPHFYRAPKTALDTVCKLQTLDLTADVVVSCFEVRGENSTFE